MRLEWYKQYLYPDVVMTDYTANMHIAQYNILYTIEMWWLFSYLVLMQLILTMKPVWWPVLYHWPVLHGLCTHSFFFDPPRQPWQKVHNIPLIHFVVNLFSTYRYWRVQLCWSEWVWWHLHQHQWLIRLLLSQWILRGPGWPHMCRYVRVHGRKGPYLPCIYSSARWPCAHTSVYCN